MKSYSLAVGPLKCLQKGIVLPRLDYFPRYGTENEALIRAASAYHRTHHGHVVHADWHAVELVAFDSRLVQVASVWGR